MPELRIRHELGRTADPLDGGSEELDPGERIGFPGKEQDRAADRGEMGRPCLGPVRRAGWMQREREEHQRGVWGVRLRGGQARDPPTVRMAADDDVGALGTTLRKAGIASSAFRFGRSMAVAAMPRSRRPSTKGRMLADVPDAPWPR